MNVKRVVRIYRAEGLAIRTKNAKAPARSPCKRSGTHAHRTKPELGNGFYA